MHPGYGGSDGGGTGGYAPGLDGSTGVTRGIRRDLQPTNHIAVEVAFHGACNVRGELEQLSSAANLTPHDPMQMVPGDRIDLRILSKNPWNESCEELPSGSYPGARGWTRLWWSYWALPPRIARWWAKVLSDSKPVPRVSVYLECSGVTWNYTEIGDQESSVVLKVESIPYVFNGQWIHDDVSIQRYMTIAEHIAIQMSEYLRLTPSTLEAQERRERIQ